MFSILKYSSHLIFAAQSEREFFPKYMRPGTSLAVQRLRLHAPTVGGTSSVAGKGTKIPHSAQQGQKHN